MQRVIKATVIATAAILIVGTASIATFALTHPRSNDIASQTTVSAVKAPQPPTVDELLKLVNEERAKVGVAPLSIDSRLNISAQRKADDMLANHYYGHISPNDGEHGYQYINDVGIQCTADGENIDENTNSDTAVIAWIHSPPHYAAMVSPKNSVTGFGIAGKDKNGYYLFVEHFCQQ